MPPVATTPAAAPEVIAVNATSTQSEANVDAKASEALPTQEEVNKASNEAPVTDQDDTLKIESLSQGTLEPVSVDPKLQTLAVKDAKSASAQDEFDSAKIKGKEEGHANDTKATAVVERQPPRKLASDNRLAKSPPTVAIDASRKRSQVTASERSDRRTAILWGLGAVVIVGAALFVLRPSSQTSLRDQAVQPSSPGVSGPLGIAPPPPTDLARNDVAAPNNGNAISSGVGPIEPSGEDTVRVAINIRPEGARVFYRGKEIGRTPFTLELLRGERRVFEVGYPGYTKRRLVIDGSEKEISYAMTPDVK